MTHRTMVLSHHWGDPGLGRFRRAGEGNDEGRAMRGLAIDSQRTIMSFDDCLRDTEPQSCSTCTFGREEGIKHSALHLCCHPDPRIAYCHAHSIWVPPKSGG